MKKLMMAVAVGMMGIAAVAGTATSFAYQGVLRDETGKPLAKEQATITFRLYDAATEGNQLWSKTMTLAIDTNGLFNAELTGGNPNLAEVIATAEKSSYALYVGLTVEDSAGEISPRQKMIATPLAAYAQNVAKADGDFTVAGTAIFNGEVSMKSTTATLTAGHVDAKGNLDVTGTTKLNDRTEVSGGLNVSGGLAVDGVACNLPIGAIIMWAGTTANIPDGWQLCDGSEWKGAAEKYIGPYSDTKKVPDLSGRFIVGVGTSTDSEGNTATYSVGDADGLNKHALTIDEMPSHQHKCLGDDGQSGKASFWTDASGKNEYGVDLDSNDNTKGRAYLCEKVGGGKSHENRPPYYALCYIIKIK